MSTAAMFAAPVAKFDTEKNNDVNSIGHQRLKCFHDANIAGSKMEPALVQCPLVLFLVKVASQAVHHHLPKM
jgi:hypothetical protein